MGSYFLALSFLTCLPIKIDYEVGPREMGASLFYYPLVGLTLGLIIAGISWVGDYLRLGLAGDALAIISLVVLTAGLHLDGLMDTADGLLSGRPRSEKLAIMKDSNVGAMGAIVLVCCLIVKITLVSTLFWSEKYGVLILMPVLGRWALVYTIAQYPYARSKPGLGSIFNQEVGKRHLSGATLILMLAGIIFTKAISWVALLLAMAIIYLFAEWIAISLGGHTGDTYGATGEIAEVAYLLMVVLLSSFGVNY